VEGDLVLHGGVANAGAVVRRGDHVLRPSNPNTPAIHSFLRHLRANGFEGASEPVGVEPDGRERLVFIPGDVGVPPYPAWAQSDLALASAAALMRRMHDANAGFMSPPDAAWSTEMADPAGVCEVICHNDVCVENIVYRNEVAVAFLDFDFAAPGRRVHDLAQFARMCVPLDTDADALLLGRTPPFDPFRRLRIVADTYGLRATQRFEFLDAIAGGIRRGGEFLQRRLDEGNDDFRRMVESAGGMAKFDRRRAWFAANRDAFAAALA
jgi:hypothetical protein